MKVCKACGKEFPDEKLYYYDYENEKGEIEHIFLCNNCLEGYDGIVECVLGCLTYVSAASKFRFRNKPICRLCADYLINHQDNYYEEKDSADIKRLKEIREKSLD